MVRRLLICNFYTDNDGLAEVAGKEAQDDEIYGSDRSEIWKFDCTGKNARNAKQVLLVAVSVCLWRGNSGQYQAFEAGNRDKLRLYPQNNCEEWLYSGRSGRKKIWPLACYVSGSKPP